MRWIRFKEYDFEHTDFEESLFSRTVSADKNPFSTASLHVEGGGKGGGRGLLLSAAAKTVADTVDYRPS